MRTGRWRFVFFVFLAICFATQVFANEVISVNFGLGTTDIIGTAGTGAYSANNWNNATGSASGTLSGLVDSSGVATSVNLSWASNEIWYRSDTAADDDARLMKSFLNHKPYNNDRSLNSQYPSTVTLTGLPAGTYSLVIYSDGDENNIDRVTVFNVNDGSGVVTKMANDVVQYPVDGYLVDSGLDYRVTSDALDYGNYIVFDNLSGSTLTIEFHGQDNVSWRGHLNGLQVVYAASAPDTEPPTVPQDLVVTDVTSSSVTLGWSASTDNVAVEGYEIYRNGNYIDSTTDTAYLDLGLSSGSEYTYQVAAYDAADNISALSDPVTIPTDQIAGTESDIISVNFGFGATDIAGTAGVGSYSAGNWNNATGSSSGYISNLLDSSAAITGVDISWSSNEIWHRGDTPNNDDDRLMKSFLNHRPYDNDRSLNSQYPSTVTLSGLPTGEYTLVIYSDGDEENINRLTVFNVNDGSGVVTKIANDVVQYPVDGYLKDSGLDYRVTNASGDYGNYLVFENLSGNILEIEFYGLNDVSWRGHLNGLQVIFTQSTSPDPDTEAPTVPQNLTVTGTTSTSVSLNWDASTDNVGVAGYDVYRDGIYLNSTANTSYTDTGLQPDTTYSYAVLAYDAAENESALSSPVNATTTSEESVVGVPHIAIDFSMDIQTWWANYPLNPESPNYDPHIPSPEFTLNVANFGGSIQAAIDALPAEGGTVFVPNGVYTDNFGIIARDNVHIVGESRDGVIIRAPAWDADQLNDYHYDDHHMIFVANHESAINYGLFDARTTHGHHDFGQEEWDALVDKQRNIAFRNLTFDGNGEVHGALNFSAVMDILIENCVFKNFIESPGHHEPAITGHAHVDNLIVRDCVFEEAAGTPLVFYMDGSHGCYLINNDIHGKLLWLTNDDFTKDMNLNGVIEKFEERNSKHTVVYNNRFYRSTYDPISYTGETLLVKDNYFPIGIVTVATISSRFSHKEPDLIYTNFDLNFVGNDLQSVSDAIVLLNNNQNPPPAPYTNGPLMGYVTIKDNYLGNTPTNGAYRILSHPVMEETITVEGNLYSQPWPPVATDPDTESPTVPQNLTVTGTTSTSVSLSWDASTDNIGVAGYDVYRGGVYLDSTVNTSYSDTGLDPNTTYTYAVLAYDAAENESALSSSVNATTDAQSTDPAEGIISINFGQSVDSFTGVAGVASYTADNWNDATGGTSGSVNDLVDNLGQATGANISWSTDEIWRRDAAAGDNDERLMRSFLNSKSNSGNPSTVTINNLPATSYTLIIYSDGDNAMANRVTQFNINDGSGVITKYANDMVQFPADGYMEDAGLDYRLTNDSLDYGNYIVIENLSGTSLSIDFFALDGVSTRGHLNGIQVIFTESTPSEPDTEAPTVPQNLTVTNVSGSSVSLSWDASTDNVGVAGYDIYRDGVYIATTSQTSYTDTALSPETAYSYAVLAYDAADNVSGLSDPVSVTTGSVSTVTYMTDELLLNPSFEEGSNYPNHWTSAGSNAVWDSSIARSGNYSMRLQGPCDTQIRQTVNLEPNAYYQFSAHVKLDTLLDKPTSAKGLSVRVRRSGGGTLVWSMWSTLDMDWKKVTVPFKTGAGGEHFVEIAFHLESGDYFYVDDASLKGIQDISSASASTSGLNINYSQFPADHFFGAANPLMLPVTIENTGSSTIELIAVVTLDEFSTRTSLVVDTDTVLFTISPGQTKTIDAAFSNVTPDGYEVSTTLVYNGSVIGQCQGAYLIFDPNNYNLPNYKPADFDQYWADTMAAARAVPLNATLDYNHNRPGISSEWAVVEFNANSSRKGRGFLLIPPHEPGEKLPVKIDYPGAGYNAAPLDNSGYTEGYVFLSMSVHDLPFDHPTIGRAHGEHHYDTSDSAAYMRTGLESRDAYFYRNAYVAMARAVDFVRTLDMVDPNRVWVGGGSQGGALALATASLVPDVALVTVNSPGRARWDKCSWDPAYFTTHQSYTPPTGMSKREMFTDVLAYCDSAIHASRVQAPLAMGIPLADTIDSSPLQWKAFKAAVNSFDRRFVVNPYGVHLAVDMSGLEQDMRTLYFD